jgi:hypothetical protein
MDVIIATGLRTDELMSTIIIIAWLALQMPLGMLIGKSIRLGMVAPAAGTIEAG